MGFTQNFQGSVGTVTNVETVQGDFIVDGRVLLTAESRPEDLSNRLNDIRSELRKLAGVDEPARKKATAAIDSALKESVGKKPKGGTIKRHLDDAAQTLKSAGGAAQGALGLAKMLWELGKWAAAIFA